MQNRRELLSLIGTAGIVGISGCSSVASRSKIDEVKANPYTQLQGPIENGPFGELKTYELYKYTTPILSRNTIKIEKPNGDLITEEDNMEQYLEYIALKNSFNDWYAGENTEKTLTQYVEDAKVLIPHAQEVNRVSEEIENILKETYSELSSQISRYKASVQRLIEEEMPPGFMGAINSIVEFIKNSQEFQEYEDVVVAFENLVSKVNAVIDWFETFPQVLQMFISGDEQVLGVEKSKSIFPYLSKNKSLNWAYVDQFYISIWNYETPRPNGNEYSPLGKMMWNILVYLEKWKRLMDQLQEVGDAISNLREEISDTDLVKLFGTKLTTALRALLALEKLIQSYIGEYIQELIDLKDSVFVDLGSAKVSRDSYLDMVGYF